MAHIPMKSEKARCLSPGPHDAIFEAAVEALAEKGAEIERLRAKIANKGVVYLDDMQSQTIGQQSNLRCHYVTSS